MKYIGHENDANNLSSTTGVLLINLGTPDRPVCPSLRRYLSEFLMDPRVIELPTPARALLVKGIIINVRSHKSAAAYREVWTEQGSPLLTHSLDLADKVQGLLGPKYLVKVAMRYGNPSVASVVQELFNQGVRNLIVIPMYPQYSGSTNGSTFDALADALKQHRWVPSLRFVSDYYLHPGYVKALAQSVTDYWAEHGKGEKLVMSFHGVPKKYITKGDPYRAQCEWTAQALASELKLSEDDWMLVFQSRLGAQEWLKPYCDETLEQLPAQGVKSVDMICPGFSVDCLETIEEIDGENRALFLAAGGEHYQYIPCLNHQNNHAQLYADLVTSPQPSAPQS